MVRRNALKRRFSGSVSTLDIGPPQKLHRTHGRRQLSGLVSTLDTGPPQSPYQYSLNAPLKKSRPMKTGLQNRVVG